MYKIFSSICLYISVDDNICIFMYCGILVYNTPKLHYNCKKWVRLFTLLLSK